MITPRDKAHDHYQRGPEAKRWSFAQYVDLHLRHHMVLATPEIFILAKWENSQADYSQMGNPAVIIAPYITDTLFINLAAGDISGVWIHMPDRDYRWIGWNRRGKCGLWPRDQVASKLFDRFINKDLLPMS